MSVRYLAIPATLVGIWLASASECNAQAVQRRYQRPSLNISANVQNTRPTVSPYTNLVRGIAGQPAAGSYQSVVRPLVNQQRAIRQNQQAINQLQRAPRSTGAGGAGSGAVPPTGHPTFFQNYSHAGNPSKFHFQSRSQFYTGRP